MSTDRCIRVFFGYGNDCWPEVEGVYKIEGAIRNKLRWVAGENAPPDCQFYAWHRDVATHPGGQKRTIDPFIETSDIGVFIVKKRVGEGMRHELELMRSNPSRSIIMLFPRQAYASVSTELDAGDEFDDWYEARQFLKDVGRNWLAEDSNAVATHIFYNNLEDLIARATELIEREVLKRCGGKLGLSASAQAIRTVQFEPALVSRYISRLNEHDRPEYEQLDYVEALRRLLFLREGHLTDEGHLLFQERPAEFVPGAYLQLTHFDGPDRSAPILDNIPDVAGDLLQQFETANAFVAKSGGRGKLVSEGTQLEEIDKFSVICIREVIANAICHRDYDLASPIRIVVFSDRVEVTSPGGWCGESVHQDVEVALSEMEGPPNSRNPGLARALARVRYLESAGRGIATSVQEARKIKAREPRVRTSNHDTLVTIYPRAEWALVGQAAPDTIGGEAKSKEASELLNPYDETGRLQENWREIVSRLDERRRSGDAEMADFSYAQEASPNSEGGPAALIDMAFEPGNYVLTLGLPGSGKSVLQSHILHFLFKSGRYAAELDRTDRSSLEHLDVLRRWQRSWDTGEFPERTSVGSAVNFRYLVRDLQRKKRPPFKFGFVEISGEDLVQIEGIRGERPQLPAAVQSLLSNKRCRVVFLLICNAARDGGRSDRFFRSFFDLFALYPDLGFRRNTSAAVILSDPEGAVRAVHQYRPTSSDGVIEELGGFGVQTVLRTLLPQTVASLRSWPGATAVTGFSVGTLEWNSTARRERIVRPDFEDVRRLFEWCDTQFTGVRRSDVSLSSWFSRLLRD